MKMTIWFCESMAQWRWTVCDSSRPIIRQESGQNLTIDEAIIAAKNTMNFLKTIDN
jgi:hypothetical protein